jgi:hypothetical protein
LKKAEEKFQEMKKEKEEEAGGPLPVQGWLKRTP